MAIALWASEQKTGRNWVNGWIDAWPLYTVMTTKAPSLPKSECKNMLPFDPGALC